MAILNNIKNILMGVAFITATCLPLSAETLNPSLPLAEMWVQTSAEYRALCYQAYGAATIQFDNWAPILEKREDGKAYLPGGTKPVAIILDLDETVVDNSGFQAFSVKTGAGYSSELWKAWVEFQGMNEAASRTVPGAAQFLAKMHDMGVTPIYISNRTQGQEASTAKVLERNGIDLTDIEHRILLKNPKDDQFDAREVIAQEDIDPNSERAEQLLDGEGRKEGRRSQIRQQYDVLAYFGDVYGDFLPFLEMAETSKKVFQQRQESADAHVENWGKIWFILPNPMYGSWSVGETIPKGEIKNSLNDFGFSTYVRGRRLIR